MSTFFFSSRGLPFVACAVAGAAMLCLSAAEAVADPYSRFKGIDRKNATSSYGYQVAPGYDRPDFDVDPEEGVAITVFEDAPLSNEPDVLDRNVNEFAGENQPFNNGIWSFFNGVGR